MGMPYPNLTDPEIRERMAYLDAVAARRSALGGPASITGRCAERA